MPQAQTVRRTMNGKSLFPAMGSLAFPLCVFGTVLLLHGCLQSSKPTVSTSPSLPSPTQTTLMTEVLAEAKSLRTTVAEERIKMAKQTANIRTAQKKMSALRNREIENLGTITNLEEKLATVQAERDKFQKEHNELQKEVTELRAQTSKIPQLLKMVAQVRILETSLEGMVSSIDALSNETAQLKEEMKKQQAMAARSQKLGSSGSAQRGPHAEDTDSIVIKRGDSLGRLAHRYDTTVADLKALNNLESDLILIGQVLKIPSPAHPIDEQNFVESLKANNQPDH